MNLEDGVATGNHSNDNPSTVRVLSSCLRNGNNSNNSNPVGKNTRVSFPDDEHDLVTGYLEPASPWDSGPVSPEDLVALYEESCLKHGTVPLEQVIDQLKGCYQTSPNLDISGPLDLASLEALETILRRVRFQTLRIKSLELNDDAAVALFDMLEYYESTSTLSICCDSGLGPRGWQACSRMIKKAHCLEELDVRGTPLNEQVMPVFCRALKVGSKLTSLQLGRCGLSGRCLIVLTAALRLNSSLQELTLADNDLVPSDASHLGALLRVNNTLRFLDISNNYIQDNGCAQICDGLMEQKGEGLEALVLWNTHLTSNSASHLASLLASSCPLETLNIGQNQIGSAGLAIMKSAMLKNRTLKQLGVQAAHISCDGASTLADVLSENLELRRIDARSNHIGVNGLTALKNALDSGAVVQRIDLDDSQNECRVLVEEIREFCRLNEARALVEEEIENSRVSNFSRKISLTCETLMIRNQLETNNNNFLGEPKRSGRLRSPEPSPIPSPASSPVPSPSRHRFRVSRVSESSSSDCSSISPSSPVSSRFRVTLVEPSTVYSDGTAAKIGFEYSPQPSDDESAKNSSSSAVKKNEAGRSSLGSDSVFEDNHSPPVIQTEQVEPLQQANDQENEPRKRKQSVPTVTKPHTGLEKLLGIFQNPSSLFSSVTLSSDKQKNTQSNDFKHFDGSDKMNVKEGKDSWDWDWSLPLARKDNHHTNSNTEEGGGSVLSESQSKNNNI